MSTCAAFFVAAAGNAVRILLLVRTIGLSAGTVGLLRVGSVLGAMLAGFLSRRPAMRLGGLLPSARYGDHLGARAPWCQRERGAARVEAQSYRQLGKAGRRDDRVQQRPGPRHLDHFAQH